MFSVETSRTRLDDKDEGTASVSKKVIKPDLSLLVSNSFDVRLDSVLHHNVTALCLFSFMYEQSDD